VEKIIQNHYNRSMARDIFSKEPDQPKHSGEDIHAVIDGVHIDYEKAKKSRSDIDGTIYFRDLLSFLIKTYGH
jgi:hypothetical protein